MFDFGLGSQKSFVHIFGNPVEVKDNGGAGEVEILAPLEGDGAVLANNKQPRLVVNPASHPGCGGRRQAAGHEGRSDCDPTCGAASKQPHVAGTAWVVVLWGSLESFSVQQLLKPFDGDAGRGGNLRSAI